MMPLKFGTATVTKIAAITRVISSSTKVNPLLTPRMRQVKRKCEKVSKISTPEPISENVFPISG